MRRAERALPCYMQHVFGRSQATLALCLAWFDVCFLQRPTSPVSTAPLRCRTLWDPLSLPLEVLRNIFY
jgi:hypothetical protein